MYPYYRYFLSYSDTFQSFKLKTLLEDQDLKQNWLFPEQLLRRLLQDQESR